MLMVECTRVTGMTVKCMVRASMPATKMSA